MKPTDLAGRRAERARIRKYCLAEAERRIAITGRSLLCRNPILEAYHAACRGATVCICECHDPQEEDPENLK